SGAGVVLRGQAVCEVNGGFGGLLQVEPMLEDQTREEARIDASIKIMASWYGCECSRVIDKAGGVVKAGSLDGEFPEAPHPFWRVKEPPGCAQPNRWIGAGDRRQFAAIDRLIDGEKDDPKP